MLFFNYFQKYKNLEDEVGIIHYSNIATTIDISDHSEIDGIIREKFLLKKTAILSVRRDKNFKK